MAHRTGIMLSLALTGLLVAACGSDGSEFGDGNKGASSGEPGGFGNEENGGGTGLGASSGTPESSGGPACAAEEVGAARKPVKLLIVLDQSGSMGDGSQPAHDKSKKWVPVTTALKSFLAEPASGGIDASMRLFPTSTGDTNARCDSASYSSANVGMTALPNNAVFSAALVDTPTFSGTPTRAVLRATVVDAKAVQAANPDAKVAIVLITDGEPAGCQNTPMGNAVNDVAGEITGTKASIPTYVIGVGSVANLNTIANAGGPRDAFIVSITDPAATQAEFLKAVDEIRGASIACDVTIPPPPAGQTLDPTKVNVNYTPSGKPTEQLKYDESCAAEGWHYDDKTNPKQVILCPSTCTTAKADPAAKLALAFGCVTRSRTVQ